MDRDDELGWETDLELNDYYPSPAEIREALAEAEAASGMCEKLRLSPHSSSLRCPGYAFQAN